MTKKDNEILWTEFLEDHPYLSTIKYDAEDTFGASIMLHWINRTYLQPARKNYEEEYQSHNKTVIKAHALIKDLLDGKNPLEALDDLKEHLECLNP